VLPAGSVIWICAGFGGFGVACQAQVWVPAAAKPGSELALTDTTLSTWFICDRQEMETWPGM
jgi:hypothetical protein